MTFVYFTLLPTRGLCFGSFRGLLVVRATSERKHLLYLEGNTGALFPYGLASPVRKMHVETECSRVLFCLQE